MKKYSFNYNVPSDYTIGSNSNIFLPLQVTNFNGKYYVELNGEVLLSTFALIESWSLITSDAIELAKLHFAHEEINETVNI